MFKTASAILNKPTELFHWTVLDIFCRHAKENCMRFVFYNKPVNLQASEQVSECLCCVTAHVSFVHLFSY